MTTEGQIAPDTKDWTRVLDRPCPDCGFVAGDVSVDRLGALVRENAADWHALLGLPTVRDAAAATVATTYERVPDGAWGRRGLRSNGSEFSVDTLGRYHLHDLVHHVHDVRAAAARVTVAAYDASAAAYAAGSAALPERVADLLDRFATSLPAGARVLEIGSGPGSRRARARARRPQRASHRHHAGLRGDAARRRV